MGVKVVLCGPVASRAHRPGFDRHLRHGKVAGVPRDEPGTDSNRGSGDQTIGLAQRDASLSERASPAPGQFALLPPQGCDTSAVQQPAHRRLLAGTQSPHQLLHVHRTDEWNIARSSQHPDAIGGGASPEGIDENRRVEQKRCHVSYPTLRGSPVRCARTHAAGSASQS